MRDASLLLVLDDAGFFSCLCVCVCESARRGGVEVTQRAGPRPGPLTKAGLMSNVGCRLNCPLETTEGFRVESVAWR